MKKQLLLGSLIGSVFLFLLTGVYLDQPTWTLGIKLVFFSVYFSFAYIGTSILICTPIVLTGSIVWSIVRALSVAGASLLPLIVVMTAFRIEIPRELLLLQFAAFFALVAAMGLARWRLSAPANFFALIALLIMLIMQPEHVEPLAFGDDTSFAMSSLYDVKVTNYRVTPRGATYGGAIHLLDDESILLADAEGKLSRLLISEKGI